MTIKLIAEQVSAALTMTICTRDVSAVIPAILLRVNRGYSQCRYVTADTQTLNAAYDSRPS